MQPFRVGEQPRKTDRELVLDAEHMLRLQNDETFRALLGDAEAECVRDWKTGQTAEAREGAWIRLQGLRAMERQVQVTIERGHVAQKRIDAERARDVGRTT